MKKKGFTLIELLVVIAIIAMLLAILMPALNKVKKIAARVVCGTNLKGLGTAQTVYANDYDDEYTVQGAGFSHTWVVGSKTAPNTTLGTSFQHQTINVTTTATNITVGASLYMLVREADVSPKSFVCPSSDQQIFSGKNNDNLDITMLWDFGHPVATTTTLSEGPAKCVSYSYHIPYDAGRTGAVSTGSKGRYAADARRSAAFAIMADKNPYYEPKLTTGGGPTSDNWIDKVTLLGGPAVPTNWTNLEKWKITVANSLPHDREGQNVLYADGHNSYETRTDVGVKNDNIYTQYDITKPNLEERFRRGTFPTTAPATLSFPISAEDSVLVNDI